MDAMRETRGVEAAGEIQAALAEAAAWIDWSGAKSYEPFLQLERGELARLIGDDSRQHALREAHRLFVELGATARAEQVARGDRRVSRQRVAAPQVPNDGVSGWQSPWSSTSVSSTEHASDQH
jgi:hypothetical protein